MDHHPITIEPSEHITLETVARILDENNRFVLSPEAIGNIEKGRAYLDEKMKTGETPIYGINTGFGALYNKSISKNDLTILQENLVKSHACGMGATIPLAVIRLMLYLKARGLSYGNSGVQVATVRRLLDFLNEGVYPVIYEQGSLGASGDLAPLAHLSLPLLGLGEVWYKGERHPAEKILEKFGWEKIVMQSKEGIALLNGTQFMSSYAAYCAYRFGNLLNAANTIAALSIDAYDGRIEPFDDLIHQIRPHRGQIETARAIRGLLSGSEMITRPKVHVQDPYSFRCIPQVHGASYDAWQYVSGVINTEINSVTDNPTIFPEEDKIISGGNFHGQPLALGLDFLCIAIAEIGSISERRTYQLINGNRELPAFLTPDPGLNSGLMIAQYASASIVSQNKQLCTPASVDTIDSSKGQEDHVSMGANAATKTLKVLENAEKILAIELLTAAQAFEFRKPARTSPSLEKLLASYREKVPFIAADAITHDYMVSSQEFIQTYFN